MGKGNYSYESRLEHMDSYGTRYETYGIFVKSGDEMVLLQHDVAREESEAKRICELLNKYEIEPEQAKYIIEDCIIESYLV